MSATPTPPSKVATVQAQVDEVTGIMKQNIGKTLDNMERAETLQAKTEDLAKHSESFKKGSTDLKRAMCCQNAKLTAIIVGIIVTIIIIIIIIVVAVVKTKK
eukprot:m51a1_g6526 putative vesicle-associated membrane protein (VAMP) (102) ;mRNA; r:2285-2948